MCEICGSDHVIAADMAIALEPEFGSIHGHVLCLEHFAMVVGVADYFEKHDNTEPITPRDLVILGAIKMVRINYVSKRN